MNSLQRAGRWVSDHLIMTIGILVLIYMFVPIAVVVLMSFNDPVVAEHLPVRRLHPRQLAAPLRCRGHVRRRRC